MTDRYVVTVSYVNLGFADRESAIRCFDALAEAVALEHVYTYGEQHVPERLRSVSFVRDGNLPLEIKRHPDEQFALDLTAPEFREAIKPPEPIVGGQPVDEDFAEVPKNEVVAGPVPAPINGDDHDPIF